MTRTFPWWTAIGRFVKYDLRKECYRLSPSEHMEHRVDGVGKAPEDFPREDAPGSVSGAQPKLVVVKVDDRFISKVDEEEICRRWLVCEDLVQQLVVKTVKRMNEGRVADLDDYVNKLQQWLEAQEWEGWKVTSQEAKWMRDRIKTLAQEQEGLK